MKNSTNFLAWKSRKMSNWFFVVLSFIVCSAVFVSCAKDSIEISNEENLSQEAVDSYKSISPDDCQCSEYLIEGENIPAFKSAEDFRKAYDCLTQSHDNWLDKIEENFPDITSEEFDNLTEEGKVNEWAVFDNFSKSGNYSSLFKKELKEEDLWLENGAKEEDMPIETLGDNVMRVMVSEDGKLKIGRETIDVLNTMTVSRDLEWCTPYGSKNGLFYNSSLDHQIKLAGGLVHVPVAGSYVYGKITAYKKQRNGSFKKNREDLDVRATCNVRKSPLNGCDLITSMPTGWKSKKTKSLTVARWNLFGTQIWYKKRFVTVSTNPDGLANGFSENVPSNTKGF